MNVPFTLMALQILASAPAPGSLRQSVLDFLHNDEYPDHEHEKMHYFHLDALHLSRKLPEQVRHCLPLTRFQIDLMEPWQKRVVVRLPFLKR